MKKKIKNFNSVVDSGVRQEFSTGSRRDIQDGKGRFDLLPIIPLIRLAKHYENGAKKYGDRNWEKGQPISRYFNSTFRHMLEYIVGMDEEDHLSAAIWNLNSIMETEFRIKCGILPKELNDMDGLYNKKAIKVITDILKGRKQRKNE